MINPKEVITKYPECLESASKLRSYLVDLYPDEKARIRVIVDSFDCGIYEQMKGADLADKLFISGLCKKLESEYGYSNSLSIWCIEQWAEVLNKDLVISTPIVDTEKECVDSTETSDIYKNIKVGDIITLGQYPQGANGEVKPIEWQVLNVENCKALVISKYALDFKPFNESFADVTWETCTLRTWLNNDFYNNTFTANNKVKIETAVVTADGNPSFNTPQGNDTQDKIFLLSIKEANQYFANAVERQCKGTDYCYNQSTLNGWWLRSCGNFAKSAAYVDNYGNVNSIGDVVNFVGIGFTLFPGVDLGKSALRPAMWIKI